MLFPGLQGQAYGICMLCLAVAMTWLQPVLPMGELWRISPGPPPCPTLSRAPFQGASLHRLPGP